MPTIVINDNKLYQICIKGRSLSVDNEFKCFSKNVYNHYPTEEDKHSFLEKCKPQNDQDWFALDIEKPYKISIVELNVTE